MWTWIQSKGVLMHDGVMDATGYSGHGDGRNNPAEQSEPNIGPVPQGTYTIGPVHDTITHGPAVMDLEPDPANDMFGRSEFLIHGDSVEHPGEGLASHGCIILARVVRDRIAASGDTDLEVVA